ncbi:hypothetical protein HG530_012988 [Fusarium avenaceum]|nr:hypothetical protein HG530_012988 [Fusarium avenaceum]
MAVCSGTLSIADLIIVHCGLHYLFMGFAEMEKDHSIKDGLSAQSTLCHENLEVTLATLPFNVPCTYNFVLAFMVALSYCVVKCRMPLSRNYLAAAPQISLTLGYRGDIPPRPEKREVRQRRIRLFSILYTNDKMLSLPLNMPSLLRERHITPCLKDYEDTTTECLFPVVPKWVKMSMLQGKVYDDIYSPCSLIRSERLQEARARELAAEL